MSTKNCIWERGQFKKIIIIWHSQCYIFLNFIYWYIRSEKLPILIKSHDGKRGRERQREELKCHTNLIKILLQRKEICRRYTENDVTIQSILPSSQDLIIWRYRTFEVFIFVTKQSILVLPEFNSISGNMVIYLLILPFS